MCRNDWVLKQLDISWAPKMQQIVDFIPKLHPKPAVEKN